MKLNKDAQQFYDKMKQDSRPMEYLDAIRTFRINIHDPITRYYLYKDFSDKVLDGQKFYYKDAALIVERLQPKLTFLYILLSVLSLGIFPLICYITTRGFPHYYDKSGLISSHRYRDHQENRMAEEARAQYNLGITPPNRSRRMNDVPTTSIRKGGQGIAHERPFFYGKNEKTLGEHPNSQLTTQTVKKRSHSNTW